MCYIRKILFSFFTLVVLCFGSSVGRADSVILETATFGTSTMSGIIVSDVQFLGVSFRLTGTTVITSVGGNMGGSGNLFAAIVAVPAGTRLPMGDPFAAGTVQGSTTFNVSAASAEIVAPLGLTLAAGDYALVFGSGLFGATGNGYAPATNPFLVRDFIAYGTARPPTLRWQEIHPVGIPDDSNTLRFVINGQGAPALVPVPTPEPTTMLLLGTGLLGIAAKVRNVRSSRES